jgi:hypothetical protein
MEKRKRGHRKGPTTILVVCEGHTEENIATREKSRRKNSAITILNMKGASPEQIIEKAKNKFFEDGGYDKVFCIFDRDSHKSFTKAIQNVQNLSGHKRGKNRIPISAIVSNPCIEIWIMCHFEIPKNSYCGSAKSVKAALKEHLPKYDKNDPSILRMIENKQANAIKNAKHLFEHNDDPLIRPFTNVHHFLELL